MLSSGSPTKTLTTLTCAFAKLVDENQASTSDMLEAKRNLLQVTHESTLNLSSGLTIERRMGEGVLSYLGNTLLGVDLRQYFVCYTKFCAICRNKAVIMSE